MSGLPPVSLSSNVVRACCVTLVIVLGLLLLRSNPRKAGHVVPDIADRLSGDQVALKVTYNGQVLADGEELHPKDAASPPKVEVEGPSGATYTLILSDPDAPSPSKPTNREWLHWLVVNIPSSGNVSDGADEVVPYMGPAPPEGVHRYVFSLFKQPSAEMPVPKAPGRAKFSTRAFAAEHNLGDPAAMTFFRARPSK